VAVGSSASPGALCSAFDQYVGIPVSIRAGKFSVNIMNEPTKVDWRVVE